MSGKPKIGIIISTTRGARFGHKPAQWAKDLTVERDDAEFEIIDLRKYQLPFFEEAASPARTVPHSGAARRWANKINELDGYIFVTAEYNHGVPAVLKNSLDYAYSEFNRKPAAFIGYGGVGGARAVEQLRLILAELQVASVRNAVHIGMAEFGAMLSGEKAFADFPHLEASATAMLDDLMWWTNALRNARHESWQAKAA